MTIHPPRDDRLHGSTEQTNYLTIFVKIAIIIFFMKYYAAIVVPNGDWVPALRSIFPTVEDDIQASVFDTLDLAILFAAMQCSRRGGIGWIVSQWDGVGWSPISANIEVV